MTKKYNVAIMGATGAVGQVMMEILAERSFPLGELRLLASARSAGRQIEFANESIEVRELKEDSFTGIDITIERVVQIHACNVEEGHRDQDSHETNVSDQYARQSDTGHHIR